MRLFIFASGSSYHGFRRRRKQPGYSLYDLIITLAVVSVLGVGAVGMAGLMQDARMTAAVNQLMGHLNLARSEAIKRNARVALCKSKNGIACSDESTWHEGWIVFADNNNNHVVDAGEAVIHVQQALAGNMTLRYGETGGYSYVGYNSTGEVFPDGTFIFCDGRGAEKAKAVIVYWTGRPRVSLKTSKNKPLRCS